MNRALNSLTIEDFERGSIDADHFDHEAHVYMAWLYLDRFDVTEAIARMSAALKRIAVSLDVPDKYHATVTWFFMLLIAERRALGVTRHWDAFRYANKDLFCRDDNVLHRYYSTATLASRTARESFVLPDRLVA